MTCSPSAGWRLVGAKRRVAKARPQARLASACKPEHSQLPPEGGSSRIKLLIKSGSAMSGNFCTSSAKEII